MFVTPMTLFALGLSQRLLDCAQQIAARRGLTFTSELRLDQPAVPMDAELTEISRKLRVRAAYRSPNGQRRGP